MQRYDDPPPPFTVLARDDSDEERPGLLFRHIAHLYLQLAWHHLREVGSTEVKARVSVLKDELFAVDVRDPDSEFEIASLVTRMQEIAGRDPAVAPRSAELFDAARSYLFPNAPE